MLKNFYFDWADTVSNLFLRNWYCFYLSKSENRKNCDSFHEYFMNSWDDDKLHKNKYKYHEMKHSYPLYLLFEIKIYQCASDKWAIKACLKRNEQD